METAAPVAGKCSAAELLNPMGIHGDTRANVRKLKLAEENGRLFKVLYYDTKNKVKSRQSSCCFSNRPCAGDKYVSGPVEGSTATEFRMVVPSKVHDLGTIHHGSNTSCGAQPGRDIWWEICQETK